MMASCQCVRSDCAAIRLVNPLLYELEAVVVFCFPGNLSSARWTPKLKSKQLKLTPAKVFHCLIDDWKSVVDSLKLAMQTESYSKTALHC